MLAKNLYVIGTGFDKHHGIPSLYSDFFDWLHSSSMANIFNHWQIQNYFFQALLWSDFERNLGNYDVNRIANNRFGIAPNILLECNSRNFKPCNSLPYLEDIRSAITRLFTEWVNSLNTNVLPDYKLHFDRSDLFLNFNYTDTLEKVYHICSDHILHIHGSTYNGEKIIFGHNHCVNECSVVLGGSDFRDDNERIQRIYEMNQMEKPVDHIIKRNGKFWDSLSYISEIYVLGTSCHSGSDIDFPYFQKIHDSVSKNAKWHIGWHNEQDKKNADELLYNLNVCNKMGTKFYF